MSGEQIGRREALKRTVLVFGGVVVLPSALAGCDAKPRQAAKAVAWVPRTLTPAQAETVATVGEFIIPRTTTPGARDARVQEFVDTILTDFLPPKPRARFLAGLERMEQRAQRAYGKPFSAASADQQRAFVVALNAAAFSAPVGGGEDDAPAEGRARPRRGRRTGGAGRGDAAGADEAGLQSGEATASRALGGGAASKAAVEAPGGVLEAEDVGRDSFFLNLKRLVIEGYYTSEVGATQELRVNPMGSWQADIAYPGHAWA